MIRPSAYASREDGRVICRLCPFECRLTNGKRGICRSRYNDGGTLKVDNYGEAVTLAIDPIEKKPLYHFHPTSNILSTGPNCCNLSCRHCQNWSISQRKAPTRYIAPEDLVALAGEKGSIGVAFTYTEPLMWYEYLMDAAPMLREAGYKVVLVTNGFINPEPLAALLPHVDAANVDLKSIRDRFYRRVGKAKLEPVLESIRMLHESPAHLELTNLVIPGYNDTEVELIELVEFVASLSPRVPLHFSAYHPSYKMDAPPTSAETLKKAVLLARKRLNYVFVGNIALSGANDSNCPDCGNLLVARRGYDVKVAGVEDGRCGRCGADTGIVV